MTTDIFLTLAQVLARTAHSKTAFYDAIKAGTYPAPRKRGRQSLWLASEIDAAMAAELQKMEKAA